MNEDIFLSALHESPNDEVTWLALADWLDEDGQSDRAELVRVVRQLRTFPVMKRTKAKAILEDRVASLLNGGTRPVVPEVVNSIGMRLALIPPGRFRMGSPTNESNRRVNEWCSAVHIPQAFYLGIFPVTQRQYRTITGTNPSFFRRNGQGQSRVTEVTTQTLGNFPVERVTWDDSMKFIQQLNDRTGNLPFALRYRLPTEAEWEYACRGGSASSTPFHYGSTLTSEQSNFNGLFPYGTEELGLNRQCPSAVGSFLPNVFGLYDMHGNVWEWCSDAYRDRAAGQGDSDEEIEDEGQWVLRGGGWFDYAQHCRSAYRVGCSSIQNYHVGFRVAADRRNE